MTLARPAFVTLDPPGLIAKLIAQFEQLSGRELFPAQYERLLISLIAYALNNTLNAVQDTGEQSLVQFARGLNLEHLGRLVGVERLSAQPALTTLEFTIAPQTIPITVPRGTKVAASGSIFATTREVIIPTGATTVQVVAAAIEPGPAGNDYSPGEINQLLETLPSGVEVQVQNVSASRGGANIESDERLRQRIILAPESFSNAGSEGAYRFHALSASQDVIDVGIRGRGLLSAPEIEPPPMFKTELQALASGELDGLELANGLIALLNQTSFIEPGIVEVYPLVSDGLPSQEVKNLVAVKLNEDKIRPLTDWVKVLDPHEIQYQIQVRIYPAYAGIASDAQARAEATLQALAAEYQQRLGQQVFRAAIVCAVQSIEGVANVEVISPTGDLLLRRWEWANAASVSVEVAA